MNELLKLRAQLTAKKIQIQALVAKKRGMGALSDLSPADFTHVEDLTNKYLDIWEEADRVGNPDAQGEDPFNKLARECHEIQTQIDTIETS